MFDRKKYKRFAKMQLKSRWSTPVVMTVVTMAIVSLMNIPELRRTLQDSAAMLQFSESNGIDITRQFFLSTTDPTPRSVFGSLASWAALFVQFILVFAMTNVYVKMSRSPEAVRFSNFIDSLSLWSKAVPCGLWKSLWLFLWSLLFFFPAVVKYYAYSQTEYLLLEYPELSVTKAMRISILITGGHKGDLFIQDLSFLGWAVLASIPAGLGCFWLLPYISMTKVNAFHGLLKDAVSSGILTREDLRG